MNRQTKRKLIKYLAGQDGLLDYLDGQGIVYTDADLVIDALKDLPFTTLEAIINEDADAPTYEDADE